MEKGSLVLSLLMRRTMWQFNNCEITANSTWIKLCTKWEDESRLRVRGECPFSIQGPRETGSGPGQHPTLPSSVVIAGKLGDAPLSVHGDWINDSAGRLWFSFRLWVGWGHCLLAAQRQTGCQGGFVLANVNSNWDLRKGWALAATQIRDRDWLMGSRWYVWYMFCSLGPSQLFSRNASSYTALS